MLVVATRTQTYADLRRRSVPLRTGRVPTALLQRVLAIGAALAHRTLGHTRRTHQALSRTDQVSRRARLPTFALGEGRARLS